MKRIAVRSILCGFGFTAVLWICAIVSANDWRHEMFDTEWAEFFAKLLIYPTLLVPNLDVSLRLYYLPPILYSFAFFAVFFVSSCAKGRPVECAGSGEVSRIDETP